MRVTYYGQACTLIEAGGRKILTDPWLTEGAYFGTWFHTHLLADAGVTLDTFPKDIDYLFLSHEHRDHLDVATLRQFRSDTPLLICKFATPKLRRYLESLGFTNIMETASGHELDLGDGLKATIFATAEYTNDSTLLIEHNGCRLFQETDCKLDYDDLAAIGERGIDIGFYMFSGANWYPMLYNYPDCEQRDLVRRRRRALLNSFLQRVKLTRPRFAVPSAGPCTVLDPSMLWLNSEERSIFVDPAIAVQALRNSNVPTEPMLMTATDVWDSQLGFESHSPAAFHMPRQQYIAEASERMADSIARARAAEPPADSRLPSAVTRYFNELVAAQTSAVRQRIGAGSLWTSADREVVSGPSTSTRRVRRLFVKAYCLTGLTKWTSRTSFCGPLSAVEPFFEDLLLSLRFRADRRPDVYDEALYHFLYEPDPEKLHNWYAKR